VTHLVADGAAKRSSLLKKGDRIWAINGCVTSALTVLQLTNEIKGVCVCIYVYIHTYIYICICICVCMFVCVCACVCVCVYIDGCVASALTVLQRMNEIRGIVCVYIYVCICVCVCVCVGESVCANALAFVSCWR